MTEFIIDPEKMPPVARDLILREVRSLEVVVRCRECDHYIYGKRRSCGIFAETDWNEDYFGDGYCSRGKRRIV